MSKMNLEFYKLSVEVAACSQLTSAEKLIAAYVFTLFDNQRAFYGSNSLVSEKLSIGKSLVSRCLSKMQSLGWISITNPKSRHRVISQEANPNKSGHFYRLYTPIAASKLSPTDKLLLTYILSYTDNGKRFYATNTQIALALGISKEAVNQSRHKFQDLGWILVIFPKSSRRELVVIKHPAQNMEVLILEEASRNMEVDHPDTWSNLPDSWKNLPQT